MAIDKHNTKEKLSLTVQRNYVFTTELFDWFKILVCPMRKTSYFLSQSDTKPKPAVNWVRDFSRALRQVQGLAVNSDWFISIFWCVLIGQMRSLWLLFFKSLQNRINNNIRTFPTFWFNLTSFNRSGILNSVKIIIFALVLHLLSVRLFSASVVLLLSSPRDSPEILSWKIRDP